MGAVRSAGSPLAVAEARSVCPCCTTVLLSSDNVNEMLALSMTGAVAALVAVEVRLLSGSLVVATTRISLFSSLSCTT